MFVFCVIILASWNYFFLLLETGRKTIKLGALPILNLPQKSHSTFKSPERRHINIVKETEPLIPKKWCKSFTELCSKTATLKLTNWEVKQCETSICFKQFEEPYMVPKYQIVVDDSLAFTCYIYGWLLPEDHSLYKSYLRTVCNIGIPELLRSLQMFLVCPGIKSNDSNELVSHAIPRKLDLESLDNSMQTERF